MTQYTMRYDKYLVTNRRLCEISLFIPCHPRALVVIMVRCADFLVSTILVAGFLVMSLACEVDSKATDSEIAAPTHSPLATVTVDDDAADTEDLDGHVDFVLFGGDEQNDAATSNESMNQDPRRRSLVHTSIIPPPDADRIPDDEETFVPTCSPSPPLAPPSANHLVSEVKRPAEGDTSGGLRRKPQPKVSKCRDNAASTVKTSKSQISAPDPLSMFYDETEHGDAHLGQLFEGSQPANAIGSNQGSADGVTFEYEDDGSISGMHGGIGEAQSGGSLDQGGGSLTIRYDEQHGNFYTMEESLSAPIMHGATTEEEIGGISMGIAEEEEAPVFEENGGNDEGQKREDSSSSRASRDVGALPVIPIISLVTLLL